eukprot:scaffold29088_cov76-Skeletonema_marinoi.AAC.1
MRNLLMQSYVQASTKKHASPLSYSSCKLRHIEGAPFSHKRGGLQHQMNAASRRSHHPAAMWSQRDGSSPNLDMYVDNVDQSYNYFARHGMKPPPLVSRSARRKLQSNNDDEMTTTTSGWITLWKKQN